ncbi:hypothetical protein N234_25575 [Ralstonia pickettii DTP0602]|nr:hypothetical protein N234_25575 [Ralstonia pickettii DTP0602]
MKWIRNRWYAAALSNELGSTMISRRLFDENVVLFRDADGHPAMLSDRCPHKGAPLSRGKLCAGVISCPYHGLQFDGDGKCVHIPSQSNIPPTARLKAYPCIERYGIAWFWPGDPDLADPAVLLDIPNYGAPGWDAFHGPHTLFPASIENILDNLVDPAHTTFVHQGTIGGADASEVPLTVEQRDSRITVGRWIEQSEPVPVMQRYGGFQGRVDRWQFYHLYAPNISLVDMGAVDAGGARDEDSLNRQYRTLSYAALTPEGDHTTHYFWFVLRTFALGNEDVTKEMRQAYIITFDEDRALLGAIQANTGDMLGNPLRLAIDNASIRLRRLLDRLLEQDQSPVTDSPSNNIAIVENSCANS